MKATFFFPLPVSGDQLTRSILEQWIWSQTWNQMGFPCQVKLLFVRFMTRLACEIHEYKLDFVFTLKFEACLPENAVLQRRIG